MKFNLSNGSLSEYALKCGYVQEKVYNYHHIDHKEKIVVQLYHDCIYHVKVFREYERYVWRDRLEWSTTGSLVSARKLFKDFCKKYFN